MILGERGPGRIVLGDLEREDELLAGEGAEVITPKVKGTPNGVKENAKKKERKLGSGEQPIGTATSTRDAREAEEVVGLLDGDAPMHIDDDAGMAKPIDDDEYEVSPSKALKARKKAKVSRHEEEEEESDNKMEKPKGRLIRRAGGRKEVEKEKTTEKAKAKVRDEPGPSSKGKGKPRKVILSNLDDDSDESAMEVPVKAKPPTKPKLKPAHRLPVDDTDEDEEETPAQKKSPHISTSKRKGKEIEVASPVRTPKRVVSVVLPAVSSKKKPAPPTRTESLRVEAGQAVSSSSKQARPANGSDLVSHSHSGGRRSLGGDNITLTPLPPKRSALIKATNHLHNVAMPDLMSYAQEKRRGFKGKESERVSDRSRETSTAAQARKRPFDVSSDRPSSDEEEAERKKKRKVSAGGSKKKLAEAASDEGSEVETRPRKVMKKVRVISDDDRSDGSLSEQVEKGKRSVVSYEDNMPTHSIKTQSSVDKSRISKTEPNTVKLMTTQVTLSDDVTKVRLHHCI